MAIEILTTVVPANELSKLKARKVLLAGEPVVVSLDPIALPGFVEQPPRDAVGGLFAAFGKNAPRVYLGISERFFGAPKLRFACAVDGYIAWGLSQPAKATTVLFGGGESAVGTNVVVLVFSGRRLISVQEKAYPEVSSHYFRDTVQGLISEVRSAYPTAKLVQAAPLTNWAELGIDGVEFIGDRPIRGLSFKPLAKTQHPHAKWSVPSLIVSAGLLGYAVQVGLGWRAFDSALQDYEEIVANPEIQRQGGIDTNFLELVNARRLYMQEPRRQTALAKKAALIMRAIAPIPEVRVREVRLPAPSITGARPVGIAVSPNEKGTMLIGPDRIPDVSIVLTVPKAPAAALDQARAVMATIANGTGMSLRLTNQGWREEAARRQFTIEGFIHDE